MQKKRNPISWIKKTLKKAALQKEVYVTHSETDTIPSDISSVAPGEERDNNNNDEALPASELEKHPNERRRRTEKTSAYILIFFVLVMCVCLFPLHNRGEQNKENLTSAHVGDGVRQIDNTKPPDIEDLASAWEEKTTPSVYCRGKRYDFEEWLDFDPNPTASLCEAEFYPENRKANMKKPVKVFIMLGEANMVGAGRVFGNKEGTLEYAVMEKKRYAHLIDFNKEWRPRMDVRYVGVTDDFIVHRNEWLSVYENHEFFGPELQFGYVMGEILEEPVILLKTSSGHNALGSDLLPPGSNRYEHDGHIYAGYGDNQRRWTPGAQRHSSDWYAGIEYDREVTNIWKVLEDIETYYPGASGYEIEGFVWWHGDTDRRFPIYASKYQENLTNLIEALKEEFSVPEAKFAIATVGHDGNTMDGNTLVVAQAQIAVGSSNDKSIATVDIRSSWKAGDSSGEEIDVPHYNNHADTFMEVGNAIGLAMAKMINN